MKKVYFDANVVVSYLLAGEKTQNERNAVLKLFQSTKRQEIMICITPLCVDEVLHSLFKVLKVQNKDLQYCRKESIRLLHQFLKLTLVSFESPNYEIEDIQTIGKYMLTYSLRSRDAFHVVASKKLHCDSFFTFDTDFDELFTNKVLINARETYTII
ncbi:MAG: hypothetical protein UX04_C0005G0001 [Microgenomates group bacterium GW2011_GWF2_45_18]|nr:MAG: hypothetical protein UW18_C0007G0001 [Microgenomates group bacterium GW2011_GWF1_44_10]KKU01582.1 MAG: hypothetical protein UX04_C0005G0001 [Microgenomates group bacterium GW2011_GWF2_45_18]OGJ41326.1 MAG: hypothetical protein A2378_03550 [Candidatus Pacebacteria bacterium RIFOXYB1_FULL_44_10]HAU99537.1 hypothetical protein [Candidatus Paceibacterota bacterium]HAX01620.1 hypothetical protein [Candidatus Paceibacterota bacterium]